MRPRLLDLFCCEGGAAVGYERAGFDVDGIDIADQDRYPFRFTRGDACTWPLDDYDAVHASPPCKDHTDLASLSGGDGTGWMLRHTIDRVRASRLPYVIENVVSVSTRREMNGALMLCGSMFGLEIDVPTSYRSRGATTHVNTRRVLKRHRLFLTSFAALAPPDMCAGRAVIGVYGTGGGGQMTRGFKATPDQAREVLGMPWASLAGCSQAIPPAYTEFLGEHLMAEVRAREACSA